MMSGLILGLAATLPAMALLEGVLFEVSSLDPVVIVLACFSIVAVDLIAGFIPASRAASVDPMSVLRYEG